MSWGVNIEEGDRALTYVRWSDLEHWRELHNAEESAAGQRTVDAGQ